MRGKGRALCHVQARTEHLVLLWAERKDMSIEWACASLPLVWERKFIRQGGLRYTPILFTSLPLPFRSVVYLMYTVPFTLRGGSSAFDMTVAWFTVGYSRLTKYDHYPSPLSTRVHCSHRLAQASSFCSMLLQLLDVDRSDWAEWAVHTQGIFRTTSMTGPEPKRSIP